MNKFINLSIVFGTLGLSLALPLTLTAGNADRVGQAGAPELLINPWARSSGWHGANSGSVRGTEAIFMNVAGVAFTRKTEINFTHNTWLRGADISINNFGLTQKVGEAGVMGLSIMSMSFGDIMMTTPDLPEGGLGTFSPQIIIGGLSYAKAFSNSIYAGVTAKVISEAISNVNSQGLALDAGIQYVTGLGLDKEGNKNADNLKFGIALKNQGPAMKYDGDGLAFKAFIVNKGNTQTFSQRSERFDLPALVNIGATYDYKFNPGHKLTFAANFTSNTFSRDGYQAGIEYNFMNYMMLRTGYHYEQGANKGDEDMNILRGPAAGFTLELPFTKTGKTFGLDYSYRSTEIWEGVHSIGARINL